MKREIKVNDHYFQASVEHDKDLDIYWINSWYGSGPDHSTDAWWEFQSMEGNGGNSCGLYVWNYETAEIAMAEINRIVDSIEKELIETCKGNV